MVAYNFKAEFTDAIVSGRKRSTIRPVGKRRHAKRGDILQLYTGMRTKNCTLLREPRCTGQNVITFQFLCNRQPFVVMHGRTLSGNDRDAVAIRDGFKSWDEMRDWFMRQYGHGSHLMIRICW